MEELWWRDNSLISENGWVKEINSLDSKEMSKEMSKDKEEVKKGLKERLAEAVKKRIPNKKFGLFFSGGVDSSLIAAVCKALKADFICYAVGFQEGTKEPEDVVEAKKVAEKLGFDLKYKIFNLKEAEEVIKKTVGILKKAGKTDVVSVGVGAVVVAAMGLGKKDKIDYFLSGAGSEEIFAGYERHVGVEDINAECWNGLRAMWGRDLVRDFNLAKEMKAKVRTPFLDRELIRYAMQIPGEKKINEKGNKVILREMAEEFLGKFAWRKKKAAQYGSCFDKAIRKLAKKEGFKLKKEWLDSL